MRRARQAQQAGFQPARLVRLAQPVQRGRLELARLAPPALRGSRARPPVPIRSKKASV
jgi:hypothetical protein